jgi:Bacterial regulatory proteins, gntR family
MAPAPLAIRARKRFMIMLAARRTLLSSAHVALRIVIQHSIRFRNIGSILGRNIGSGGEAIAVALTDEAIEKIKSMIVSGALRPGDRLPNEVDLSAELGLSRLPLLAAGGGERALDGEHPRRAAGRRHLPDQPGSPGCRWKI